MMVRLESEEKDRDRIEQEHTDIGYVLALLLCMLHNLHTLYVYSFVYNNYFIIF